MRVATKNPWHMFALCESESRLLRGCSIRRAGLVLMIHIVAFVTALV